MRSDVLSWRHARLLIGAAALACLAGACSQAASPPADAQPETLVFGMGQSASTVTASCVVRPRVHVKIKSEVAGRVDSVLVEQGDNVSAGQLLAVIDTRSLRNEIGRLDLSVQRTRADIELLELQLLRAERARDVMDQINRTYAKAQGSQAGAGRIGSLGAEELDLREKQVELRRLKLALADLQLRRHDIERSLGQTQIRAPHEGVVLSRTVEVGSIVGSGVSQVGGGDVMFEVADVGQLKAECFVREAEASTLKTGMPVKVTVDARRDASVDASVTRVSPAIELVAGVPRLRFESDLKIGGGAWIPGVNATAVISGGAAEGNDAVPSTAVSVAQSGTAVFVRRGRGFVMVPVQAQRQGSQWRVHSGLAKGDMVAVDFSKVQAASNE